MEGDHLDSLWSFRVRDRSKNGAAIPAGSDVEDRGSVHILWSSMSDSAVDRPNDHDTKVRGGRRSDRCCNDESRCNGNSRSRNSISGYHCWPEDDVCVCCPLCQDIQDLTIAKPDVSVLHGAICRLVITHTLGEYGSGTHRSSAKFSLLFFFRRLVIGLPRYMWIWYCTFAIIMILYLASMASNLLTCTPLDKYWSSS